MAQSGVPFVDLAANQVAFAKQLQVATAAEFTRLGLVLQAVNVQNPRLSEDLQKVLDQKIGVGTVGDAIGLGAGVAWRCGSRSHSARGAEARRGHGHHREAG